MLVNNIAKAKPIIRPTESTLLVLNDRALHHFGGVEIKINYFNYLPFNISVVERNGFRHPVQSTVGENNTQSDFIVRTTMTIMSKSTDAIRSVIDKMDIGTNDDLQIIKSYFVNDNKGMYRSGHGYTVVLETRYTRENFINESNELYCVKRDIVISTKSLEEASAHPYEPCAMIGNELGTIDYKDLNCEDYAIKVEHIDNLEERGIKYFYSLGGVVMLSPKKDPKRNNGIYVTKIEKNLLSSSGTRLSTHWYEYDQAKDLLKLYDSKLEAQAGGDIATSRKLELEKRSHDNTMLKRELDEANIIHKRTLDSLEHDRKLEQARWDEKIKILERDNGHLEHMRELERSERKDYFEKTSQSRKDSIDVLKFLPQLVIGIGAILLAIDKYSNRIPSK